MSKSLLDQVVGEVRAELARQRKSQRWLASVLHLSQAQISDRLLGKVAFNVPELEATAEALGVPVTRFLGESARAERAA